METTYVDVPTNFISRKSESPFHKQQLNHNMSIPLVQIPLFEKMSLYKESEKKIEAQRALKLKLKALGKFHKSGVKPQKSPRGHEPMENKSMPGLPTIWSYRINQTVQDLKSKNSMNLTLNNTKPEVYLDKSRVLDDDPYKTLTSEPDTLRAINNLAGNFFVKSHFTSPKAHRPKLSETNYQSLVKDNSVEGAKSRVKTLHDMPSPSSLTPTPKVLTKPPQSPQARGSSLGKIPEIRRFVISPKRDISPEIPFFAYGGSPRSSKVNKPSMLTLLKDKGTMSQNSLLNSFLNSKEEKGSPTPTSPKTHANKFVKTFYQDPSSIRLFHDQKKSDKKNEDMEEIFDFEQDVVLNSTPTISIPTEAMYLKPQSSQQSPEPLSPEKVKSKHSMRSLQKSPTQLKLNNQKAVERLGSKQPRMQKRMETIALKLSQRMTQFNPIFDVDALDATDPYLKPFVSKAQEKNLPPIARRTLEMIIVQRRLLKRLEKIRNLKLTLQEVMRSDEIFATQPYARSGSKELLIYVKLGKTDKVKELLQETQKYIVYDFDHVHLTALHWAAKKGFNDIAKLLIDYGADVDAKDVIGRTPLYFAIQNKNEDLVKMLLANWAEPWSTEDTNYKEVLRGKEVISYYLSKMKKVHIGMKLTPPHQRALFWQREAIEFLNSYMHPLSDKKIEEKKGGTLRWYKGALNGFTMKV